MDLKQQEFFGFGILHHICPHQSPSRGKELLMVLVTWKESFSHFFFFNPSGCRENLKAVILPNSGLRFAIPGPMKAAECHWKTSGGKRRTILQQWDLYLSAWETRDLESIFPGLSTCSQPLLFSILPILDFTPATAFPSPSHLPFVAFSFSLLSTSTLHMQLTSAFHKALLTTSSPSKVLSSHIQ